MRRGLNQGADLRQPPREEFVSTYFEVDQCGKYSCYSGLINKAGLNQPTEG
jgi:hypothetical protein